MSRKAKTRRKARRARPKRIRVPEPMGFLGLWPRTDAARTRASAPAIQQHMVSRYRVWLRVSVQLGQGKDAGRVGRSDAREAVRGVEGEAAELATCGTAGQRHRKALAAWRQVADNTVVSARARQ